MDENFGLFYSHINEESLPLTATEEKLLQQQLIDGQHPGTILHDFQVILDFLCPNGTDVSSANHFLPMKSLADLNQRLNRPITITLKRPQQKSFPHLHGLYLLLRASGLTLIKAKGKKQRLVLDEVVLEAWNNLNPTEQYFTLLESWLLWSNEEILGGHQDYYGRFYQCTRFWASVPEEGLALDDVSKQDALLYFLKPHHAALFELFGFITIQPGPVGREWRIAGLMRSQFGNVMMKVLTQAFIEQEGHFQSQTKFDFTYGAFQPVFQSFFPEWQQNLAIPGGEFEEGIYIFKVSLLKAWRQIAIPNTLPLDDLAFAIVQAFKFDFDHLYQFSYKDRFGVPQTVAHPAISRPPYTDETLIGDLPLTSGTTMTFLFDFGDRWEFQVQLEKIEPSDPKLSHSQVLATHGEAPKQYWDEGDWNEDN